ncbi:MAG: Hsp20/alpha crystallin family protein, partial [Candidatus Binataceae bacterium]
MVRRFRRASRETASTDEDRHVAFDGYRNAQYDGKLERDRRYGTVYTVAEAPNAYVVRLELPHCMPISSLQQMWQLAEVTPEYDLTIELSHNVLAIRGRLYGEALRRLAYVSASFPSGFLTRIEFAEPVAGFKHRLASQTLEVIVLKSGQPANDVINRA